jgi:hypothetical protein
MNTDAFNYVRNDISPRTIYCSVLAIPGFEGEYL